MTARLRRVIGPDREAGSVTVFFAITVVGLLVLIGLVVDGGVKIRAAQRADAVAAEAARAAGQVVALPDVVGHQNVTVDRQGAVNAANAYLAAAGETGTVAIGPDGTTVEVTVTTSSPTTLLSLIGISTLSVTGHGEVTLVHRVSEEQP
ncbi:pilus assembly protein TadG-related protein [Cellulomonas hominis]